MRTHTETGGQIPKSTEIGYVESIHKGLWLEDWITVKQRQFSPGWHTGCS